MCANFICTVDVDIIPEVETAVGYDGTTAMDVPPSISCEDRSSTTQPLSGTCVCVCVCVCVYGCVQCMCAHVCAFTRCACIHVCLSVGLQFLV